MSQFINYPKEGPAPALEGGAVAAPSQLMQCQPILRRDPTNVWSKLEAARGRIYAALSRHTQGPLCRLCSAEHKMLCIMRVFVLLLERTLFRDIILPA